MAERAFQVQGKSCAKTQRLERAERRIENEKAIVTGTKRVRGESHREEEKDVGVKPCKAL